MSRSQGHAPSSVPAATSALVSQWPLTLAAALVLAPLLVQTIIAVSPEIYWDTDPRSLAIDAPNTMLGPAAMAMLNTLTVAAAAWGMLMHLRAGGRLYELPCILVALGVAAAMLHLHEHSESMFRGANWIAATTAAVALYHLAQHDGPRRLAVASLTALSIPLILKAASYLWWEHPETVRMFNQQEDDFLRARGWSHGSAQHVLYRRRLEQWDVTGYFGLSNVFGSLMLALTVITASLALGHASRRAWKRMIIPAVIASLAAVVVLLTRSKGAILTLGLLLPLMGVLFAIRGRAWSERLPRLLGPAALALIVLAVGAVVARGIAGPPQTAEGERSILFRAQYWDAAGRMIASQEPLGVLLGVGPGRFQQEYLKVKDPLNPEEVISTHNVEIDYAAMLGLGGVAWAALLAIWLVQAGRRAVLDPRRDEPFDASDVAALGDKGPWEVAPAALLPIGILAVLCFVTQFAWHWPMLLAALPMFLFAIGAGGFVLTGGLLLSPLGIPRGWANTGLFFAAAGLLLHSQIEMTFTSHGSACIAWAIVALAAAPLPEPPAATFAQPALATAWRSLGPRLIVPAALALLAVLLAFTYLRPVRAQQALLAQAREELRYAQPGEAIETLAKAFEILPNDPRLLRWRAILLTEQAGVMATGGRQDLARLRLDGAIALLEQERNKPYAGSVVPRTLAMTLIFAGDMTRDPSYLQRAAEVFADVLRLDPYSLQDHLRYADTLWALGRYEESRALYREALTLSEQAYLDPAKQLNDAQRVVIDSRLEGSPPASGAEAAAPGAEPVGGEATAPRTAPAEADAAVVPPATSTGVPSP